MRPRPWIIEFRFSLDDRLLYRGSAEDTPLPIEGERVNFPDHPGLFEVGMVIHLYPIRTHVVECKPYENPE